MDHKHSLFIFLSLNSNFQFLQQRKKQGRKIKTIKITSAQKPQARNLMEMDSI